MYNHIKGKLVEKAPTHAVIECNGLGYQLNISLNTFSSLVEEEQCMLFAHLVVREDAHLLYGFGTREERSMFRHLIEVSGVGANTAILVLSSLAPHEVKQAITENDVDLLKSIKGIGPRSAQRIIVDLKDKLEKEEFVAPDGATEGGSSSSKKEAISALQALGFDKKKSEKAVEKILAKEADNISLESLVKDALKHL